MNPFNLVSLLAEVAITMLGILLATEKKKIYGWLIALTFGIYVFYDSTRFFSFRIPSQILSTLFLIASISILLAVWNLYREKK